MMYENKATRMSLWRMFAGCSWSWFVAAKFSVLVCFGPMRAGVQNLMIRKFLNAAVISFLLVGIASGSDNPPEPVSLPGSIDELMVLTVTPATNILWGADDPQTDAEWNALDEAAQVVVATFNEMKLGGTGENDANWVADPAWQAYTDEVIAAALAARRAIEARNPDALYAANDVLYPPCENCHVEFHPELLGGGEY